MKKLFVLILAILIAGCQRVPEESCMAVEFTGVNGQYINFGSPSSFDDIDQKTISYWAYHDNSDVATTISKFLYDTGPGSPYHYGWKIYIASSNRLVYREGFDSSVGEWVSNTSAFSTGAWVHFVVTFDNSSDSNNPSFYVNGSSITVNESTAPSGTVRSDAPYNLYVGNDSYDTQFTVDGKIQDVRIYNRILSQTEIDELYNSRCQRVVMNGLVFWLKANGDTNYIDEISGVKGTAYGSPIAIPNTIQRIY